MSEIQKSTDRLTSWGGIDINSESLNYLHQQAAIAGIRGGKDPDSKKEDDSLTSLEQSSDTDYKLGVVGNVDNTLEKWKQARRSSNGIKI